MRYLSVCSGIEAATVAWHPLGWQAAFFSEIEAFPSAVLAYHWPEIPNLGDMTQFAGWPDRCDCEEPDTNYRTTLKLGSIEIKIYVCSKCGGIRIDLLVGGTPCQSFSIAGLRKGLDDPRGNLMLTFGAIAARYRPRWLVWENVSGVLSSAGGCDFASFLGLLTGQVITPPAEGWANSGVLSGIPAAYGLAWRTLDAQYFGVAQRRRRVFVIGHLGGHWPRAAAVLFERASLCGNPPPRRQKGKGFTNCIAASLGASGRGTERTGENRGQDPVIAEEITTLAIRGRGDSSDLETRTDGTANAILTPNGGRGGIGCGAVAIPFDLSQITSKVNQTKAEDGLPAGTLNASGQMHVALSETGNDARAGRMRGREGCAGGGKGPLLSEEKSLTLSSSNDQVLFQELPEICPKCCAKLIEKGLFRKGPLCQGCKPFWNSENVEHIFGGNNTSGPIEVAPALNANRGCAHPGDFEAGTLVTTSRMAVRRLTPRECERLQGFPDDYTLIKFRRKPACDGPRYKCLGNSMARPVMLWLGERIELVDTLCPFSA